MTHTQKQELTYLHNKRDLIELIDESSHRSELLGESRRGRGRTRRLGELGRTTSAVTLLMSSAMRRR